MTVVACERSRSAANSGLSNIFCSPFSDWFGDLPYTQLLAVEFWRRILKLAITCVGTTENTIACEFIYVCDFDARSEIPTGRVECLPTEA